MQEVRIGIIGCGKIGEFHAAALKNIKNCRLVAAANRSQGKMEQFCSKYALKGYLSYEEMIVKERLDAVTICTPHPTHASIAVNCANLGCHIMIEKPLAVSVEECDEIISAGKKNRVLIGTLVQRRNYLPCMRIKRALDEGLLGKPILGEALMVGFRSEDYYKSDPWRGSWQGEGGGVLMTQASHQIDLLNWYMGEIDSIFGLCANFAHPSIEVEDAAVAVIKYKSGGMATLLASNNQNPALYGKVHVFGDNGACAGVQTDGGQMFIAGMTTITEPPFLDIWTVKGNSSLEQMNAEDIKFFHSIDQMLYFHQKHLENFIDAILGKGTLLADAQAGRATVEVCQAVYEITKNKNMVWHSLQHCSKE